MSKKIIKAKIANAVTSAAVNHIVCTSDDVYDENLDLYQSEINQQLADLQERVNVIEGRYLWARNNPENGMVLSYEDNPIWENIFFSLKVSANNTEYGKVSGNGTYPKNSSIEISATPYYGYEFVSWSDGISENPRTIVVTEDKELTAIFAKSSFNVNVSVSSEDYGSVSGSGAYEYLDTATIAARTKYGTKFVSWSDGKGNDKEEEIYVSEDWNDTLYTRYLKVVADTNLVANFAQITFNVMFNNTITGEIDTVKVNYGSTVTKPEDPKVEGYDFYGWFTDKEYTQEFDFSTKIYSDTNLYGKFETAILDITFQAQDSYLKLEGNDIIGKTISLSAVSPSEKTVFKHWLINGEKVADSSYTIATNTLEAHAVYGGEETQGYSLLTSADTVSIGDQLVFASAPSGTTIKTMSTTFGNNFSVVNGSSYDTETGLLTPADGTAILTVESGYNSDNKFSFKFIKTTNTDSVTENTEYYLKIPASKNQLSGDTTKTIYSDFSGFTVDTSGKCAIESAKYANRRIGYNSASTIFSSYTATTKYPLYVFIKKSVEVDTTDIGLQTYSTQFSYGEQFRITATNNDPTVELKSWVDSTTTSPVRDITVTKDELYRPLYEEWKTLTFCDKYYSQSTETDLAVDCINPASQFINDTHHKEQVQFYLLPFYDENNKDKEFSEIDPVPCFVTKEYLYGIKQVEIEYCVNNSKDRGLAAIVVEILDENSAVTDTKEIEVGVETGEELKTLIFDYSDSPVQGKVRVSIKMKYYSLFFKRFRIYGGN